MDAEPIQTNRRRFMLGTISGLTMAAGVSTLLQMSPQTVPTLPSPLPDTLFLTWQRDPTTTMTVQWVGPSSNNAASTVHFAELGHGRWNSAAPAQRPFPLTDLWVYRTEITQLKPGTEYQFRIGGSPAIRRFRTMPSKATNEFQFISGGDCGVNEHVIANNIIAAKQDPMFALIGGDVAYDNGEHPESCLAFLANYSQHMVDSKGRLIPMVVCIGNHDVSNGYNCQRKHGPLFFALHDGLYAERSFATLDFGDYLSLVLLDTGHVAPIAGEQTDWLARRLAEREELPHLIAVNHVPAYPSYRRSENERGGGQENRQHWVPLFERHNVNVVLEHHDHTFKRTRPLLNGHIDRRGVVYLGDGSWGRIRAPKSPEKRAYLAVAEEQYHLTLHRLEGAQAFHMALSEHGRIMDVSISMKRSAA